MDRLRRLLSTGTLASALIGCTGTVPAPPATTAPPPATPVAATPDTASPTPSASSAAVASPKTLCPTAIVGEPDPTKVIIAKANIYSAGRSSPVAPGGGGTGNFPPEWPLPAGDRRVVTISGAAGCVTPAIDIFPYNGPAGDVTGPTKINAHDGISGIVHGGNGMFVVGVFLTDAEPENPAPPTLDFTENDDFESIEPEIGQTFFVGDGRERSSSRRPRPRASSSASRMVSCTPGTRAGTATMPANCG